MGLAIALISSIKNTGVKLEKSIVIGEVGLTGEIRSINSSDRLAKEAEKMGFEYIIIPSRNISKISSQKIKVIGVNNLREAINKIF